MGDAKREVPPGASPISGLPPPVDTRWKKGQSGNPGGRPKGESITALLRRVLEREHQGKKLMEVLAERMVSEAIKGKFPFAKELLDRVEGRVGEQHEVTVKTGWEAALASVTDEELINAAIRLKLVDRLPPALRERAKARLGGTDAA